MVEGGPILAVEGVGVPPAIEKNCTFVFGGIGAPTKFKLIQSLN